jgi:1-deoxy-D-xylulose-5-phosphate reductoisomerase
MQKQIAVIGSTGSIGRQTLEVIKAHPQFFKVEALACHSNIDLLLGQIRVFKPNYAVVFNPQKAKILAEKIKKTKSGHAVKILSGKNGLVKIVALSKVQKIVFASSGLEALKPLLKAIKLHKEIALANKELIVAAGGLIMRQAKKNKVKIIPIDSEHSAIFQCLQGEELKNIEKIILTCSGGPFLGFSKKELQSVKASDALNHPVWKMGKKISIDSATLMNKAFEIIEAMHLFGLKEEQIEVVIHPESIIHSMVVFKDGSVKAQMSPPDMRIPITYALAYPQRIQTKWPRINFSELQKLTFHQPDFKIFEGPGLSLDAVKKGGTAPALLIMANNRAVSDFLAGKIPFSGIYPRIRQALKKAKSLSFQREFNRKS